MKKNKKIKKKRNYNRLVLVALFAVFLAGVFFFSPKAQELAFGKLVVKGNFFFNGGEYDLDKAAKYYKVAGIVDWKASYPHYQLARIYFLKADYEKGRVEIDKALALNPENKRAYYIRGLIDGYAESWKVAEDDFQKFIAWAPKEWAGYNDLAWAYYEDEKYQEAADAAQKGLEVAPDNAWLLNGLGVSLQALGKNDEAKVALEKSVELAKAMTPADWRRAYPGNDAQTAEWDMAQFKTDVNYNVQLAENPFSSGKGKFQAACSSSTVNVCSGTSCVPTTCDPDHCSVSTCSDVLGCESFTGYICGNCQPLGCGISIPGIYVHGDAPGCSHHIPCSTACDCGVTEAWTPTCGTPNCTYMGGSGILTPMPGVTQTSNCGGTRCVSLPACPANNNPTVSISSPSNGSADVPTAASFAASVTDPDAGDTLTYNQTLTCGGSPQTINNPASGSGTSPINLSFTQSLPAGSSCTWTINANDDHAGSGNGASTFTVASAPPSSCTLTCPDSVIVPPGDSEIFCTVSGSGCSMQSCTTQDDGDSIIDGSPGVSGNSCETAVKSSAGYESTAVVRARSNDGQTDDVTIFVRRLGWIEVNP